MAEPSRCRFCDEPLKPDNEGSECDSGCKAGYTLFMPEDEDAEDEPTIEAGDRLALAFTDRETKR